MANVLNKLLEICEILDTKGGSGGGSTGGGSGGSVSIDGGTHIGKIIGEIDIETLNAAVSSRLAYILLGRYNDRVVKDLTVLFQLFKEEDNIEGAYMFKINTNADFNSMIEYRLLTQSAMSSTIGSVSTMLCSITWDGETYLALKIATSSLKTDVYTNLCFYVVGTDSLEKDGDNYEVIYPEKTQLSSLNEVNLSQISVAEKQFFGSIVLGNN